MPRFFYLILLSAALIPNAWSQHPPNRKPGRLHNAPAGHPVRVPARPKSADFQRQAAMKALQRMMRGETSLTLTGQRVTQLANNERLDEHIYRSGNKMRIEYTGPDFHRGEIFVADGDRAWYFHPVRNNWMELGASPREQLKQMMAAIKNGQLQVRPAGRDHIAGRNGDVVELSAPGGALVERLVIDDATGLVLKRDHFENGRPAGGFQYASVDFNPAPGVIRPDFFSPPPERRQGQVFRSLENLKQQAPFQAFEIVPNALPPGNKFRQGRIGQFRGKPFVALHYAGGGHQITLFQAEGNEAELPKGAIQGKAGFITYFWRVGSRTLALVGNLSEAELKQLSQSVSQR